MFDVFGFGMMDNYEQRAVDRFEDDKTGLIVDTCAVTDSDRPFETGIQHPAYNDGKWVIVQLYDTKQEAKAGHKYWVKKMTSAELPKQLRDVSSAIIAKLCDASDGDQDWRTYKKAN